VQHYIALSLRSILLQTLGSFVEHLYYYARVFLIFDNNNIKHAMSNPSSVELRKFNDNSDGSIMDSEIVVDFGADVMIENTRGMEMTISRFTVPINAMKLLSISETRSTHAIA
jgi:hypothetical protein